jgi:hypothetical protein
MDSLIISRVKGDDPSEKALVTNSYLRELNGILMSTPMDTVIAEVVKQVRKIATDDFSERDLGVVLVELIKENIDKLRGGLA